MWEPAMNSEVWILPVPQPGLPNAGITAMVEPAAAWDRVVRANLKAPEKC